MDNETALPDVKLAVEPAHPTLIGNETLQNPMTTLSDRLMRH
jgi:hypothetical protein